MAIQTSTLNQVGVASVILNKPNHRGLTNKIDDPDMANTIIIAKMSQFEVIPHLSFKRSTIFFTACKSLNLFSIYTISIIVT